MVEHDGGVQQRRLAWKCRRGMLELDMLFNNFLILGYNELGESEKLVFDHLLDENDQQLYEWFFGLDHITHSGYRYVIEKIRATTQA